MTIRGVNIEVYPVAPSGQVTTLDDFKRAYDELQQAGGNGVALNPVHYVSLVHHTARLTDPLEGYPFIWADSGLYHNWPMTVSPDLIFAAAVEAKKRNLTVMLKPMFDPVDNEEGNPAGWRGDVSVKGDGYDLGAEFLSAYLNPFMQRYLALASEARVDMLCVGTELVQATKELGADWLRTVLQSLRWYLPAISYTYAANWGVMGNAEYNMLKDAWLNTAKIGVDAYFELLPSVIPMDDKYEQAVYDGWHRQVIPEKWCLSYDDDLAALCGGDFSKIWFTEVGYRADTGAAVEPGIDPSDKYSYEEADQVKCWRAFRRKWDGKLGAYFAWDWRLHPEGVDPRAHNIRGKAEATKVALAENWE